MIPYTSQLNAAKARGVHLGSPASDWFCRR